MTKETKLGIFVIAGLIALVGTIMLLGNFSLQKRYTIYILFDDIAGLPDKAKVKIAGVEVGAVSKITLEGNRAKLKVWIKQDVQIHCDTRASIVATGIIGSKYLELTMGSPSAPMLKDGDVIVGVNPVSLDKVVAQIVEKIDTLFSSFQGQQGKDLFKNLAETMENIKVVTATLRKGLENQEAKITAIVNNVDSFSKNLSDITGENRENIRVAIGQIREASEKLNMLLAKLESGQGTIGKLVNDQQMGDDLKETVSDLKETIKQTKNVVRRLNLIETQWDYTLRYDTKYAVGRSDVGLRIIPRPGKFYYVGASNLSDTSDEDTTNDPEKKNTFNLLLGREWDRAQVYAGMIRTTGGFGGAVKPFKWGPLSRMELTAEGYNFTRKTPVARPVYNVGVRAKVNKYVKVGAYVQDAAYASSINAYGNVAFRDDDIAYILGLVGLAKP